MQPMNTMTDADLERLGDFLVSDDVPDSAMDVATLEGFLTALAIGPRMAMPSAWLPWVWDLEHGKEGVIFASTEQANEIVSLIMGWSNQIANTFRTIQKLSSLYSGVTSRGAPRNGAKDSSKPPNCSTPRIGRGCGPRTHSRRRAMDARTRWPRRSCALATRPACSSPTKQTMPSTGWTP